MSGHVLPGCNADLFPDELPDGGIAFDYSPGAVAQRVRLLEALRKAPVTTFEARDVLSVTHPASRVQELRDTGYKIFTGKVFAQDAAGVWHGGVARYVLLAEPEVVAA
jgi:hypothetical protein